MAGLSPTQRTLKYLRKAGYTCVVTEHWNAFARVRVDLFGFADIVSLEPLHGIVAYQATSGTNVAARIQKITGLEDARRWCICGGNIIVVGWRKTGPKGKRKVWSPRWIGLKYTGRDSSGATKWEQWEVEP